MRVTYYTLLSWAICYHTLKGIGQVMTEKYDKGVKFAQQGGPVSDKIEGLSDSAKSVENDKCYHISKNKKKIWPKIFYGG